MKNKIIKIENQIKNKIILITGASGNLGSMMAYNLGILGAKLILIDNSIDNFKKLKKIIINKKKIKYKFYECNLENQNERENLINKIYKEFNYLNVLINNAAFVGESNLKGWNTKFPKQSLETWRRAFEVNLTTPFHLIQSFENLLNKSNNASIINISSIYGELGPKWDLYKGTKMGNPAAYSSSKGGLVQLSRWLAVTLAPNIRVNSICLGGVHNKQNKLFKVKYKKEVPLNRMATPKDLLGAIILLSSDMSKYITGQSVKVDGGWSAW